MRVVGFTGTLLFLLPGGDRQRVGWDGEFEMDKDLTIHRFRIGVVMHETGKLRSEVVVLPAENVAHYTLTSANGILERQDYSLDEQGARDVMRHLGVDASMLPLGGPMPQAKPPVIKAHQSSLDVHGERMDTYLVTVEVNGQTLMECHVNQLGQVVKATTILGYSLLIDDITP